MNKDKFYKLPELSYGYNALEPYISEDLLRIHHRKHHQAYVDGANGILGKLDQARQKKEMPDMKASLKELSFHIGGHILHSLFWENLMCAERATAEPTGSLAGTLKREFGSFARFQEEFNKTALSIEGSGWAALTFCRQTERPLIAQIEKHNVNFYPDFKILMVLDFWEHAYYLDYRNEKAKFLNAFWNIVNWEAVATRL